MSKVNPNWYENEKRKIQEATAFNGNGIYECTVGYAPAATQLVLYLTNKNISFKVYNLGAGVKKITTDTSICPKCKGTGRC